MTEAEAKTKWCPFARGPAGQNRSNSQVPGPVIAHGHCIGSACMAWRRASEMAPEHGFCGLAGSDTVGVPFV